MPEVQPPLATSLRERLLALRRELFERLARDDKLEPAFLATLADVVTVLSPPMLSQLKLMSSPASREP
jgi:hypothetical protein